MTFAEIERVVGSRLPKSQEYQAWWSNSTSNNVMTKIWLDAGYRTEQVDTAGGKLVFKRVQPRAKGQGMSDLSREYQAAEPAEKKRGRHPAIGAMKGTFWIDPTWDLTQPTMSEEELAEMEENIHRTADRIDAGFTSKPR